MFRYLIACVLIVLCVACFVEQDPTPVPTRDISSVIPVSKDADTPEELLEFTIKTLLAACDRYEEVGFVGVASWIGVTDEVKDAIQTLFVAYTDPNDKREYCRRLKATTG
ncbi:MAG: hypothetical protein OXI33_02840 [Chloroflexota bacterium]|nr:hypothetical protein [Chloroflexota bacterium]